MNYLRAAALVFTIASISMMAYMYGRYVETRRVLSYELVTYDYDILIAKNAIKSISSDNEKANKLLKDHIEFKKASATVNKQWLDDMGYLQFLFSILK